MNEISSEMFSENSSSTLYIPIASPPTPAPSPGPGVTEHAAPQSFAQYLSHDPARLSRQEFASLASLNPSARREYLASILSDCTPSELLFVSTTIAPLLKRDFLREFPPELALYVLDFVDDPRTLARATQVSKHWHSLLSDESLWRKMCKTFDFEADKAAAAARLLVEDGEDDYDHEPPLGWLMALPKRHVRKRPRPTTIAASPPHRETVSPLQEERSANTGFSYYEYFKSSFTTMMNWRSGGILLRTHRPHAVTSESGVITSVALDIDWVVAGLANCKIYVFSARTGVLARTLIGHELGVWAVNLVSRGGFWNDGSECAARSGESEDDETIVEELESGLNLQDDSSTHYSEHTMPHPFRSALGLGKTPVRPTTAGGFSAPGGKQGDVYCASDGWGQPNSLVVSGGCDKKLRVWDVKSGHCLYALQGHTSTIRCVKVLHNRPIAVTGSRDSTLRVWDVQRGRQLRVLHGHQLSVRCLAVCGNRVVSGSYDATCRLWDVDTGECLHVLRGHFHQIYSIAFDGVRVVSGGLDTTVRVWDATTGKCIALLQGHTALVCQLQLSPTILATGGSDGRVITFCLSTFSVLHRIAAHDSSVTSLQFDARFLVTGGNDGRVRLFETATGNYIRELSERSDSVWKVVYRGDVCAIMCKRGGKTAMEIWSFKSR